MIKEVLQDPAVLAENVYNIDETGVMLSMLGSVKVLVSKHDKRDYRGVRVKRRTVTAIECISGGVQDSVGSATRYTGAISRTALHVSWEISDPMPMGTEAEGALDLESARRPTEHQRCWKCFHY